MSFEAGSIRPAWAALPIELIVGVVFFAHGLTKLIDPQGFATNALGGIPSFLSYLVIVAEFGGGLLLLSGLLVRLGALGHLCVMIVAVTQVHWSIGLTERGGFEFPLTLLATSIALLILGPDPLSIDDNIGISIHRSREAAFRRESIDIASITVKAAGILLILAGIALPLARDYLGVPHGTVSLVILIIAGLAAVASGAGVIGGKPRAYVPSFVIARLFLAASILLLFWVKYTIRGSVAVIVSLAMLAALGSARRKM